MTTSIRDLAPVCVSTKSTSYQAKKTGRWALLPSWNFCSEAFKTLANCRRAPARSLREGSRVTVLDIPKRKSCFSFRNLRKIVLIALASYAMYQCIIPAQAAVPFNARMGNPGGRTIQSITSSTSSTTGCVINGTEEFSIAQSFKTWDIFSYSDQGRLIVAASSPLLQDVRLIQSPMKNVGSFTIASPQSYAIKGNALYLSTATDNLFRVIDTTDLSNLYVANILNVGAPMNDMLRVDNRLYMAGPGIPLKIFDIDSQDSLQVTPISQITNSSINANRIASMGNSSFGCAAANSFFCLDASNLENPIVVGSIPNLKGTAIAASESGYYYVGTSTGLAIVNATNPLRPTQCGFVSTAYVFDVYYESGLCSIGTVSGMVTVDVSNPCAATIKHSLPISSGVGSLLPAGDLMYFSSLAAGIGIFDRRNASNPIVSVTGLFPEMGGVFLGGSVGDQIVIVGNNDVFFATGQDAFTFSGIPKAGTKGSHEVTLMAKTLTGVTINDTRSCTFNINPVITPSSPLSNIIGVVGQVINAVINPNAFIHAGNLQLKYDLNCASDKSTLSSAVTLNPVSGQFSSRTLTESDVGTANCIVEATDSYDASGMSSFNITAFYGPTVTPISNQLAISGQSFFIPVTATSRDAISEVTFAVSGLPSSLSYRTGNITGTPSDSDLGSYPIQVTATDQNGIANTQSFTLTIAQPGYPVITESLESYTVTIGTAFVIVLPQGIVTNPDDPNAEFTYSVQLADGSSLPGWVNFDERELKLSGKPSDESAPIFETTYTLKFIATQKLPSGEQRSASTTFNLTVTGNSIFRKLLFAAPFVTGVLGFIGGARVSLYNSALDSPRFTSCVNRVLCCSKRDIRLHHERIELFERQSFKYVFRNSKGEIAGFKTSYDGKSSKGSSLPSWMKSSYNERTKSWNLSAMYVPTFNSVQTITITAVDSKGYDLEKVTFTRIAVQDERSFERPCFNHGQPVTARFFYTGNPQEQVDPPTWLTYDRERNVIRARNAPPLGAMKPMRIELVDSHNRKLEIIYLNQPSDEMLLAATDEVSSGDNDLSENKERGLIISSTSASTSTSSTSTSSPSSVSPSTSASTSTSSLSSISSSSGDVVIELTESKKGMSQQSLLGGLTESQSLT